MTEEMKFFLFLIERYASKYGRSTGDVLREWDEKGITNSSWIATFSIQAAVTASCVSFPPQRIIVRAVRSANSVSSVLQTELPEKSVMNP